MTIVKFMKYTKHGKPETIDRSEFFLLIINRKFYMLSYLYKYNRGD